MGFVDNCISRRHMKRYDDNSEPCNVPLYNDLQSFANMLVIISVQNTTLSLNLTINMRSFKCTTDYIFSSSLFKNQSKPTA